MHDLQNILFFRTLLYIALNDHFSIKYMTYHCLPNSYVNLYLILKEFHWKMLSPKRLWLALHLDVLCRNHSLDSVFVFLLKIVRLHSYYFVIYKNLYNKLTSICICFRLFIYLSNISMQYKVVSRLMRGLGMTIKLLKQEFCFSFFSEQIREGPPLRCFY